MEELRRSVSQQEIAETIKILRAQKKNKRKKAKK
jgi:hypothetical protein